MEVCGDLTKPSLAESLPCSPEVDLGNSPWLPVLQLIELRPPQLAILILLMTRAVKQDWTRVIDLNLANWPTVVADFEVISSRTPEGKLIAA